MDTEGFLTSLPTLVGEHQADGRHCLRKQVNDTSGMTSEVNFQSPYVCRLHMCIPTCTHTATQELLHKYAKMTTELILLLTEI